MHAIKKNTLTAFTWALLPNFRAERGVVRVGRWKQSATIISTQRQRTTHAISLQTGMHFCLFTIQRLKKIHQIASTNQKGFILTTNQKGFILTTNQKGFNLTTNQKGFNLTTNQKEFNLTNNQKGFNLSYPSTA